MTYYNHVGSRFYRREDYEDSLPPPSFGPDFLAQLYGPVSRFFAHGLAEKLDGWLRKLDEKGEAMQEHDSANSHKITPKAVFICGMARSLRHRMRGGFVSKLLSVAAGTALVMGAGPLLGAGFAVTCIAAAAALPVSAAVGAICLTAARAVPRAAAEGFRAICNIPVGYSRRRNFFEQQKYNEERAQEEEKSSLGPLCQAVFDDEKLAEKSTPGERANWIYGLAKHFPEEFLEAARKTEKREAVPAAARRAANDLKNLPN
ncbi:MAG: hypothetical protein ACAH80_04240 [Alphaproteobacteria bacterium]